MSYDTLNHKQQRFVDEYLICLNATQAAVRAGYSEKSAGKIGHRLVEKSVIKSLIDEKRAQLSEKSGINLGTAIDHLAKIGFADIPLDNIKPSDKIAAIKLIVEYLELVKPPTQTHEITGKGGGPLSFAELPLFDKGILKELSTDELSLAEKLLPMLLDRISKGDTKGKGQPQS